MKNLNSNVIFVSVIAVILSMFFIYNKSNDNEISVVGRCSKQISKDKFSVSIRIKNIDDNPSLAMNKTLNTYKEISEYIKEKQKTNPDLEVQTTEYTSTELKQWNHVSKKNEKIGVEGAIGLQIITSNSELLSQIIFDFGKFSDVFTSKLGNFTSETLYSKEANNCIKEAMLNAKAQANIIASSLGQSVGKMVNANYYNNSNRGITNGPVYKMAAMAEDRLDAEPATIFSASQNININVDVRFELK